MKKSEKKIIIENFEERCDCREDDNCGCSFPNNTRREQEAEAAVRSQPDNHQTSCKNRCASRKA